jgi:hypothetical protein
MKMEKEFKPVFVVGMFRSGTTLVSKALDVHSKITVVDDPFFQFFKSFRNEIFCSLDKNFDKNYPVSDNFFSDQEVANKKLDESTFKIPFNNVGLEEVKKNLFPFCEFYCPELAPKILGMAAETYDELFRKLLDLEQEVYGSEKTELVGCKNTFSEQFIGPLINTYPNIKIIQIIRDPRAVMASQNKSDVGTYPILFALRHWRKSIAYALEYVNNTENFLLIKYEDFVENPVREMKKVCGFLGVIYEENMVDAGKYKGKKGQKWEQNSSFGSSREITKKFSEKWKEVLKEKEVQFIEDLCEPEMKAFGYGRSTNSDFFNSVLNPPNFDIEVQDWVREYEADFEIGEREMNKEIVRYLLLNSPNISVNNDFLKKVFVTKNFLTKIKP